MSELKDSQTVTIANSISPRGLDVELERKGGPQFPVPTQFSSLEEREKRHKTSEDGKHGLKPHETMRKIVSPLGKPVEPEPRTVLEATKIVGDKLRDLDYSIGVLFDALNEVARIHPIIAGVVVVFGAVYKLESTRRDNDNRVDLLYAEMRDMLQVLLELRKVKKVDKERKARLGTYLKEAENDIKEGANACQVYKKKATFVRFIKSPIWEKRFADFMKRYRDRRKQFAFELTIGAAASLDKIHEKLSQMEDKQDQILNNTEMMTAVFESALSPGYVKLKRLVQEKGSVGLDEESIKQLLKDNADLLDIESSTGEWRDKKEKAKIEDIIKELRSNAPDTLSEERKNMDGFERKFLLKIDEMKNEMKDAVQEVVTRESDRVISTITSVALGPRGIVDKDMFNLWTEMKWGGHVKASHFILALRDFYQQRYEKKKAERRKTTVVDPDEDEWAYRHINLPYLQHILEAIDDDASGFVTIPELNRFTSERPKDWSLPHCIAYWAVGWYSTMQRERDRINQTFDKMHGVLQNVLPENQPYAVQYLTEVWLHIAELSYSLKDVFVPSLPEWRFRAYEVAKKRRLKRRLKDIRYNIDSSEALYLVTGPGRVEKHLFTLISLLLERHLELFRLCKRIVIDSTELREAGDSIKWVLRAVWSRYSELKAIFKSQRRDIAVEFSTFSFGLYEYWNDQTLMWAKRIKDIEFQDENDEYIEDNIDNVSEVEDKDDGFSVTSGHEETGLSDAEIDDRIDAITMVEESLREPETTNGVTDPSNDQNEQGEDKNAVICGADVDVVTEDGELNIANNEKVAVVAEACANVHPTTSTWIDYLPYEEPDDCSAYVGEARISNGDTLSGRWNMLIYENENSVFTSYPVLPCDITTLPSDDCGFRISNYYTRSHSYTGSGLYTETDDEGTSSVNFRLSWAMPCPRTLYYEGRLGVLSGSISGSWGACEDKSKHSGIFMLRRTPSQILRFRPAPSVIEKDKACALWDFARSAVLYQVRKRMWSWSFLSERRQHRKDYTSFTLRMMGFGRKLSDSDLDTYHQMKQELSPYDVSLYDLFRRRQQQKVIERRRLQAEEVLNHTPDDSLDCPMYEEPEDSSGYDGEARILAKDVISGDWAELLYNSQDDEYTICHMWAYVITHEPSESQPHGFRLSTSSFRGDTYNGSGSCTETDDKSTYDVRFCLSVEGGYYDDIYYVGKLDVLAGSISGTWGTSSDASTHSGLFILKRTPSHILRFRPALSVFAKNKARALWDYAVSAALHLVRRRLWSWSYFRERRDHRRQYLVLAFRKSGLGRERSQKEHLEYWRLRQLISCHDAPYYDQLKVRKERSLATRSDYRCDACGMYLDFRGPGRITCVDCKLKYGYSDSVNFCLDPACLEKPVDGKEDMEGCHKPSHRVLLLRRDWLLRNKANEIKTAMEALRRGEEKFKLMEANVTGSESAPLEDSSAKSSDDDSGTSEDSDEIPEQVRKDTDASLRGKAEDSDKSECAICQDTLKRPCWFCVDCTADVFICITCNRPGGTTLANLGHDEFHTLVRIGDGREVDDEDETTVDKKLEGLQKNINTIEKYMQDMNQRQDQVDVHYQEVVMRQIQVEEKMQSVVDWQSRVEEQIKTMSDRQTQMETMLGRILDHLCQPTGT